MLQDIERSNQTEARRLEFSLLNRSTAEVQMELPPTPIRHLRGDIDTDEPPGSARITQCIQEMPPRAADVKNRAASDCCV